MAIILNNNPLPRTGALYVSNPRRRKNVRNKDAIVARQLGITKAAATKLKERKGKSAAKYSKDIKRYNAAFKKAGGEATLRKERAKTKKSGSAWRKKTFGAPKRTSAKKKRSTKKTATGSKKRQKVQASFAKMSKAKQAKLKRHAKDQKWKLFIAEFGGSMSKASSLYKRLKKGTVSNPRRRKNVATKSKGRKIKYKTFNSRLKGCGLTSKQKS